MVNKHILQAVDTQVNVYSALDNTQIAGLSDQQNDVVMRIDNGSTLGIHHVAMSKVWDGSTYTYRDTEFRNIDIKDLATIGSLCVVDAAASGNMTISESLIVSNTLSVGGTIGVGLGTYSAQSVIHASGGSSGSTFTPVANTIVTIENDGNAVLSFLTPSTADASIVFGDTDNNYIGGIEYSHGVPTDIMFFKTGSVTATAFHSKGIAVYADGVVTPSTNLATLLVYQTGSTASVSCLYAAQNDIDQPFISYNGTSENIDQDRSIVVPVNVSLATISGYKQIYVVDSRSGSGGLTTGIYYEPIYSLTLVC